MMKILQFFLVCTLFFGLIPAVCANDLIKQYNQIMHEQDGIPPVPLSQWEQVDQDISAINNLEKYEYETKEKFTQRRNAEIKSLEDKLKKAMATGDAGYQAGTLTKISYNADNKLLNAEVVWRQEVTVLLPEIKGIGKAFMSIPPLDAKRNFSKQESRPLYITIAWDTSSFHLADVFMAGADDIIWPVITVRNIDMQMVDITGGILQIGCVSGQKNCGSDEKPVHYVKIKPFYMGKYEVTFAQWDACVAAKGCGHSPKDDGVGRGNRAVNNISWNDIQEYITWLNQMTDKQYRLPTEAEWEYAARAGSETEYCFGNSDVELGRYAWYKTNASDAGEEYAHTVGKKKPNVWGLYDMHGNVWEWTADWYGEKYYSASQSTDHIGTTLGVNRVYRGGSWNSDSGSLYSACRYGYDPYDRYVYLGFRLALSKQIDN